jgi:hypothetical protein
MAQSGHSVCPDGRATTHFFRLFESSLVLQELSTGADSSAFAGTPDNGTKSTARR